MPIPPATEPSLFWDVMSYLVVAACVVLILAMALVLATALIRGGRDDDDDEPPAGGEPAPVESDALVLAARARLDAARRDQSHFARVHGLSGGDPRVASRSRTPKGFRR